MRGNLVAPRDSDVLSTPASAAGEEQLYVVEVNDRCQMQLAGQQGCSYISPAQPAEQALVLVRALLGCAPAGVETGRTSWSRAIPGGTRTVRLCRVT